MPLSDHQRGLLYALMQRGNAPARTLRRAHTRLLADEQQPTHIMAAGLHNSALAVTQTCERFLRAGLGAAANRVGAEKPTRWRSPVVRPRSGGNARAGRF